VVAAVHLVSKQAERLQAEPLLQVAVLVVLELQAQLEQLTQVAVAVVVATRQVAVLVLVVLVALEWFYSNTRQSLQLLLEQV
jgi:hypothetical protein